MADTMKEAVARRATEDVAMKLGRAEMALSEARATIQVLHEKITRLEADAALHAAQSQVRANPAIPNT